MFASLLDSVYQTVIGLGIVGVGAVYFLRPFIQIPFVVPLIQTAFACVAALGAYKVGESASDVRWKQQVHALQIRLASAESQSAKETVKILEKTNTKVETVTLKGEEVTHFIEREVVKYNDDCKLPDTFIKAHNMSVEVGK
jgi:hypothetical protein